ncbi:MAG: helix-turn-helix domain-containing protein [Acidobacteria bacterium]|nr:helix-turn-helix domain-containing protein [Acidobacteriota bacterium]
MTHFTLQPREYVALANLINQADTASDLRRAYALLWLADGDPVDEIAQRLGISRQSVYNWVTRFQARRNLELDQRLADGQRGGRPRTAYGIIDPLLEEVIDADPRRFDYRSTIWTAPLLAQYLRDSYKIDVSSKSVSRAIERLKIRWKRPRHRLALRSATWRQAKGGLNTGSKIWNGRSS